MVPVVTLRLCKTGWAAAPNAAPDVAQHLHGRFQVLAFQRLFRQHGKAQLAPTFFSADIGQSHGRIRARPHKQNECNLRHCVEDSLRAPLFQPARSLQSSLRGGHPRQRRICPSFASLQARSVHGGACRPRPPARHSRSTVGQECTHRHQVQTSNWIPTTKHTVHERNAGEHNPKTALNIPARTNLQRNGLSGTSPAIHEKPRHVIVASRGARNQALGQQFGLGAPTKRPARNSAQTHIEPRLNEAPRLPPSFAPTTRR